MESNRVQVEKNTEVRRWQSLNSLYGEGTAAIEDVRVFKKGPGERKLSESSVELCMHSDGDDQHMDSGICERMIDSDMLAVMEKKIDLLSDKFLEQCRLLTTVKEELRSSKIMLEKTELAHNQMLVDMLQKAIAQRMTGLDVAECSGEENETVNSRARSLLNAIESRQEVSLDSEVRDSLVNFLQSEELKDQMIRATVESVRGLIGGCFSRDMSRLYLPVLERSHRRLIAHIHKIIEQAFFELEDKSSSLFKSVYKTSGALRRALERHQCLLEASADPGKNLANTLQCTVEELLHKELKEWRNKVADLFSAQSSPNLVEAESPAPPLEYGPDTPPHPAGPDVSVIDQLMQTALINKQIAAGDVNGSFERALTAGDLSLVMVACRAVDPDKLFAAPCSLQQHVLLSLVQQLATDMLHETQLKCRYLEEGIINLDSSNPDTRGHLPLVVGEVRQHLSKFLVAYPNHVAGRRITLIVMAANNLLK